MSTLSKQEVLELYRDKIPDENFDLSNAHFPLTPAQLYEAAECMEIIGEIGDDIVWKKRKIFGEQTGPLVLCYTSIGIFRGLRWAEPKLITTCDKLAEYLSCYISHEQVSYPCHFIVFTPPADQKPRLYHSGAMILPIAGTHPWI